VVDLAHGKFGRMAGERAAVYWERIMKGMKTQSSQLVPKFASL